MTILDRLMTSIPGRYNRSGNYPIPTQFPFIDTRKHVHFLPRQQLLPPAPSLNPTQKAIYPSNNATTQSPVSLPSHFATMPLLPLILSPYRKKKNGIGSMATHKNPNKLVAHPMPNASYICIVQSGKQPPRT